MEAPSGTLESQTLQESHLPSVEGEERHHKHNDLNLEPCQPFYLPGGSGSRGQ